MAHASHTTMSKETEQCVRECLECYSVCTATAAHCLDLGGRHASRQHQTALLDCATICQTSADFMLRGSPMLSQVCGVCADACRTCEEKCRSMAAGDQTMQQCADACRRCAESCDRMAAMA